MEHTLSSKLTALAALCLTLGTTLAAAAVIPPTNAQLTTLSTTASDLQSSGSGALYLTMKQIAARLHTTAVTVQNYADTAEKNGSLTQFKQTVLANKSLFFATPDSTKLHAAFKLAQAHGYQEDYNDFSRQMLAYATKQKQVFWNHLQANTAHADLTALAGLYQKAADALNAGAAELQRGGNFLEASYHPVAYFYFVRMLPGDCTRMDMLAGLYGIAGLLFPTPLRSGWRHSR